MHFAGVSAEGGQICLERAHRATVSVDRTPRLAIVDFLFVRVAQLRFDSVEAALEQTRAAVEAQRIGASGKE